jgi:uncharacterized membrane protein
MATTKLAGPARKNIESIADLEREFLSRRSLVDRVSDRITTFAGSITFVVLHIGWFAAWVLWNRGQEAAGRTPFDPYPYIFLNLALSIEAVLLATFVLITQNRQARQSDQWAHLSLQVNLLAEQETTKMLRMLQAISDRLGLHEPQTDMELKEMIAKTRVEELVEHLDEARDAEKETSAVRRATE